MFWVLAVSFINIISLANTWQVPESASVRTDCVRLIFSNYGNIGNNSNNGLGGYNMGFFDDCDTTDNTAGADDNASVYLADAGPFVMRIMGSDTVLEYSVFNSIPGEPSCFIPTESVYPESTLLDEYYYGYSGVYTTSDSAIGLKSEYYAPKDPAACDFIVARQIFYNNTDHELINLTLGEIIDWNVPSDSGVYNGSEYDENRKAMWCFGAEYDSDSIINNDCVLADQRFGGVAYYRGCLNLEFFWNIIETPQAMWTETNHDWVVPTGGIVAGQLYQKAMLTDGYETWEATGDYANPDSMYQDLHMVIVYGQFDLSVEDTLSFVKILTSVYDGGEAGLLANIDEAVAWIENHDYQFPEINCSVHFACCWWCGQVMGDVNEDYKVNILDISYLISYLYIPDSPGLWCEAKGDINCDCGVNILDITCMISHLYDDINPCPICSCTEWENNCYKEGQDQQNVKKPPCLDN
jgi:hypothetical protein